LRDYDLVVIYKSELEDQALEQEIDKVTQVMKEGSADISEIDRWGKKPLGYQISSERTGTYVVFRFRGGPSLLPELKRELALNENVLRHRVFLSSVSSKVSEETTQKSEDEQPDGDEK
jgi:small subunit ribosomal protein S6